MNDESANARSQTGWRLRLGLTVLIIGLASPLLIPVIAASGLPVGWKTAISGALAIGIPEVFSIIAIAIMGKDGFDAIKSRFYRVLKKHAPADRVGKTRHRVGLVMFVLPLLIGWLGPYLFHFVSAYEAHRLSISIIGDVLLVASFFVLGGDFWDKFRALFVQDAIVQMRHS
ncbi:MAG: transporter suffix domain-containing protein [Gammaproteobacteria bacterium]|nr:transporter suffix domain-containing protein [Gammaproteobacteria bacterium]